MKGNRTNGFGKSFGGHQDRVCISPRNLKRLARKNKDVIDGSHSEHVGREAEEEKDERDSSCL